MKQGYYDKQYDAKQELSNKEQSKCFLYHCRNRQDKKKKKYFPRLQQPVSQGK